MRYIQISRPFEMVHIFEDCDLICVYNATGITKTKDGDYYVLQHGKTIGFVHGPAEIHEVW